MRLCFQMSCWRTRRERCTEHRNEPSLMPTSLCPEAAAQGERTKQNGAYDESNDTPGSFEKQRRNCRFVGGNDRATEASTSQIAGKVTRHSTLHGRQGTCGRHAGH